MSKAKLHLNICYSYRKNPERVKRACRVSAAFVENASDPFYYKRLLNLCIRGIIDVALLETDNQDHLNRLTASQRFSVTDRVGFILEANK